MTIHVRKLCQEAIDLVKRWEGFVDHIYTCPAGKPTIGYGHYLQRPGEREKYEGKTITEEEAVDLLRQDLLVAQAAVQKYIDAPLSDEQYGALVSFTFNLGAGALQRSTLRSKLNREEYVDAADEFERWVYAGGRKLKGLMVRRSEEKALFLAGTINGNGSVDIGAD